jgi:glutamate N-acetyltransferase/amino-acid N-acetyltransferase
MKHLLRPLKGSITAAKGFRAAAVAADVRGHGDRKRLDLAIVASVVPCHAAGAFTTNQIKAAPVKLCLRHLRDRRAQAIVVNSGNANACTGTQGTRDAALMAEETARLLALKPWEVLVCSTGRIGTPMPMKKVLAGIREAAAALSDTKVSHSARAGELAARAIMTTDTKPKQVAVRFDLGGKQITVGGIAKGAGMIAPGMSESGEPPALHATMISVLTTDAAVERRTLQQCLNAAVAGSFNSVTVDGDMSTNDTVLLLANGMAGNQPLSGQSPDFPTFQLALNHVTAELARSIARDGEGASKFITVRVVGAVSPHEARIAAHSIANSALCKTAWYGGDSNWGRILDAVGYSPAKIVEEKADVSYNGVHVFRGGQPVKHTKRLNAILRKKEFTVEVHLHLGDGAATVYTCDLTHKYVDINKAKE